MRYVTGSLCALFVVSMFAAGCRYEAAHATLPDTSDADAQFLYGMLDHHMHWDKMIDPCLEKKGIHTELLNLCASMEAARTTEVAEMTKMLSEWFGKNPPRVDPFPDWVGTLEGAEFERNFLDVMSKHHSEGIDLGAKCAEQAKRQELKAICTKVEDQQRGERTRMRELACHWFQACS